MSDQWIDTTWGDIATLHYGKSLKDYGQEPGLARVFGTNGPIGWHSVALVGEPGLIIGRKGAYRGVHYSTEPFWVIDTAYYLKPKVPLDLRWAYYALLDYDVNNIDDGSPIPSTTRDAFYFAPVKLPPFEQQQRIAAMLDALDAKIEHNRQMTATLEETARALFQSWFVDFDPVHAKAEGRDPALSADIAALFPDRFGDDGLPEGWAMDKVGALFDIVAGNTPSTFNEAFWGAPHAWATPKDMSSLRSPILDQTSRQLTGTGLGAASSGLVPAGSLLLSSRAPIGYLAFAAIPLAINQGIAAFVKKEVSTVYAWAWCQAHMDVIKSGANGSTFQEISKGTLRQLPMLRPTREATQRFDEITSSHYKRILQISCEIEALTQIRSLLLPKLISGDLRIPSAANEVAAA